MLLPPPAQISTDQRTVGFPACGARRQPLPHLIANSYWLKGATSNGELRFYADYVPVDMTGRPWPTHLTFSTGPGLHRGKGKDVVDAVAGLRDAHASALGRTLQVELPVVYEMAGR
jgi:hypothetical protein